MLNAKRQPSILRVLHSEREREVESEREQESERETEADGTSERASERDSQAEERDTGFRALSTLLNHTRDTITATIVF